MSDVGPDKGEGLGVVQRPAGPSAARRVVRLLVTLIILGGGAGGFLYYRTYTKEKQMAAKKAAHERKGPQKTLVRVVRSRTARVLRREKYVGELAALRTVELGAKVGGRVVRLTKELGQSVAKGEVIARIDDADIVPQIAEAKTAVEVARSQIERARADLRRAEADAERADVEVSRASTEADRKRPLFKQQLVTQQEMDNLDAAVAVARSSASVAKTAVLVAKSAVSVAEAQLRQAEARLPVLKVQLENMRVMVPFAGRVNKRYVEPGAMVAAGTPIYQIVTDRDVIARFKVPERDLHEIPEGKEVSLDVEAYPGEKFRGRVVRVSPAVEPQTRTVLAEAEPEDKSGRLKPGMFARVEVLWSVLENVVLAPQRALVRPPDDPQGRPGVFVHEAGVAKFIGVTLGVEQGEDVEVRGLASGVDVIVEGQHGLKAGGAVALAPATQPAATPAAPAATMPAQAPANPGAPPAALPSASPPPSTAPPGKG
jgi:RND family efflux transporter MFP subunit